MFSNEKIKQVFNAIKDNGIEAFDDESLAKLLSKVLSRIRWNRSIEKNNGH